MDLLTLLLWGIRKKNVSGDITKGLNKTEIILQQ